MKERYLVCMMGEDCQFFATQDRELFEEAERQNELQEWLWDDSNVDKFEELDSDISGITVIDICYGYSY